MVKQVNLTGQLGDKKNKINVLRKEQNLSKIFGVAINTIESLIMANQEIKRKRRKMI